MIYFSFTLLHTEKEVSKAEVRVIGVSGTSLISEMLTAELKVENKTICADVQNDILPIACVERYERYGKNGNIGHAFVKGFGLKRGAMATSMGHDHHNITVLGTNAEDMAVAVNRIGELDGGIVIVDEGKVLYELALPICGLLCVEDGLKAAETLSAMQEYLNMIGCPMESPFMSLSFVTLTIPGYAITDKGLIDVKQMKCVPPILRQM